MKKMFLLILLLGLGLFALAGHIESQNQPPSHLAFCCLDYPFPKCPPECSGAAQHE